jgi:hypothetical protein
MAGHSCFLFLTSSWNFKVICSNTAVTDGQIKIMFRKKLRRDYIQGILAAVRSRILCLRGYRLEAYTASI